MCLFSNCPSSPFVPHPSRLQAAVCCSLCNDSHLHYAADRGVYQRVGEATEVALRVLAEKVGTGFIARDARVGARVGEATEVVLRVLAEKVRTC